MALDVLVVQYLSYTDQPPDTDEPIDWQARYDDLSHRIDYLTSNIGHEDANGYIPDNMPELQELMDRRDQIREIIIQLVETDGEGYNGKYDSAFEPLINSLVKETRQGEKFINGIQTGLDVAGYVPGFGEPADALDALNSFAIFVAILMLGALNPLTYVLTKADPSFLILNSQNTQNSG